jgi:hypothetical protein
MFKSDDEHDVDNVPCTMSMMMLMVFVDYDYDRIVGLIIIDIIDVFPMIETI